MIQINISIDPVKGGLIKITANDNVLNFDNFKLDFTGQQLSFSSMQPVTDHNGQQVKDDQENVIMQTMDILKYIDPNYCNFELLDELKKSIWWDCENILMTSNLNADNLIKRELEGNGETN